MIRWLPIFVGCLLCSLSHGQYTDETAFQERRQILLDYVANYYPRGKPGYPPGHDGKLSDFGKYNYPLFIAWLEQKKNDPETMKMLDDRLQLFSTLPTFHFNLVGLPRLLYKYSDNKSLKQHEEAFLMRVWERDDSYNAFTAEGTENHIAMSKPSGYLYAQLALEKYPGKFPKAAERLDSMKQWIQYWSKWIFYTGTGEFNSATYQTYSVLGWLNLFDFAKDHEVKLAARAVLDYYAAEIALHIQQGMPGGSDMRGQGIVKSLQGSYAYLAWLWYGDSPTPLTAATLDMGRSSNEIIQSVHAATSSYRPPNAAVALATKQISMPAMYYNSKPAYLLNQPSLIKQTLYLDSNYSLGAGYFRYGGWGSGNNQIISWKFISRVTTGEGKSAQYASGIGLASPDNKQHLGGNKRSPFDQVVHHKNVLVHLTKLPENAEKIAAEVEAIYNEWRQRWALDFAKRFPGNNYKSQNNPVKFQQMDLTKNRTFFTCTNTGDIQWWQQQGVLFVAMEQTLLAIQPVGVPAMGAMQYSADSSMLFAEVSAPAGNLCGFVMEVASRKLYSNIKDFETAMLGQTKLTYPNISNKNNLVYKSFLGDELNITYQERGTFTEPMFDFGYGVTTPNHIPTAPPFRQPKWPKGQGHGKTASWKVNGQKLNLQKKWAVYEGDYLTIKDGKMWLGIGDQRYHIDYTGKLPVYHNDN